MKVKSPDELTRFTMTNLSLKDAKGNIDKSSLKDWQTQVASMTKALNSATNSIVKVSTQVDEFGRAFAILDIPKSQSGNARPVFNQKLVDFETKYGYLAGSLAKDPYSLVSKESDYRKISFNKSFYGTQSKRTLKKTVEDLGGTVENNPTKKRKDQMRITFPISESEWQDELLKTSGDETKAKTNLSARFTRKNLQSAEKYSNDVASENKEKQEQKEKENKEKQEQKEKENKEKQEQKEKERKEKQEQQEKDRKEKDRKEKDRKEKQELKEKDRKEKQELKEKERKEKQEQKEKDRKEKQDKQSTIKALGKISLVLKVLQTIADVTRRILTATLSRASEIKREGLDAKSLGVTYNNLRHYSTLEGTMGLKEGAITSAIGSLQSAFGDPTHLDENALAELAKVMGSGVINAINTSKNNPEALMGNILDEYFKRGQKGINSVGQQVGQYQAERELATALEKAGFSDMADVLRNMFYTNDTGIYKDRANNFASYSALIPTYTNGLTAIDHKKAQELGQVVDGLKTRFNDLKKNLEEGLLISLEGLINKIDNWDIGKSATEKMEDYKSNRELNQIAYDNLMPKAKISKNLYTSNFANAGISFNDLGIEGVSNVEEYLAFTNTENGHYWEPKNESQKSAFEKLKSFLATDEGKETIKLVHYSQTVSELAKKAEEANIKGVKTGKIEYDKNAYTEAGIAEATKDNFEGVTHSDTYSAVNLAYLLAPQGNARDALYTKDDIFREYEAGFLGGNFTYEKALWSKDSKSLTKDLLNLAQDRNADFKVGKKESKEDAVRRAIAEDIISDEDARSIAEANVNTSGYGISTNAWGKSYESVKAKGIEDLTLKSGVYSALAEGLQLQEVQNIMASLTEENAKNTVVSVGGYNAKTGEVQFTLTLKDEKGKQKQLYSGKIRPDVIIKEGKTFEYSLSDVTSKSNERGE